MILNGPRGKQEFEGKCWKVGAKGHAVLQAPDSSNIHLLEDSPDSHYNDWVLQKPQDRFHDKAGFAFYVKPR